MQTQSGKVGPALVKTDGDYSIWIKEDCDTVPDNMRTVIAIAIPIVIWIGIWFFAITNPHIESLAIVVPIVTIIVLFCTAFVLKEQPFSKSIKTLIVYDHARSITIPYDPATNQENVRNAIKTLECDRQKRIESWKRLREIANCAW